MWGLRREGVCSLVDKNKKMLGCTVVGFCLFLVVDEAYYCILFFIFFISLWKKFFSQGNFLKLLQGWQVINFITKFYAMKNMKDE